MLGTVVIENRREKICPCKKQHMQNYNGRCNRYWSTQFAYAFILQGTILNATGHSKQRFQI
jgi:hypothetical protein